MTLSERIRLARRKAGLSQMSLAAQCCVQRSAVANWEAFNGASPAINNLIQLACVTGVSFEWLATGRGLMQLPREHAVDVPQGETLGDPHERRLVHAFRASSARMRTTLLELAEEMAYLRTGTRMKSPDLGVPLGEDRTAQSARKPDRTMPHQPMVGLVRNEDPAPSSWDIHVGR